MFIGIKIKVLVKTRQSTKLDWQKLFSFISGRSEKIVELESSTSKVAELQIGEKIHSFINSLVFKNITLSNLITTITADFVPFSETAPAPVGHTVLGLLVETALTVLLLVCTITGMILQKLSRNSSRSLSETVQGPVARGEEYLQMERSSMAQEETGLGEKRVEKTEVN